MGTEEAQGSTKTALKLGHGKAEEQGSVEVHLLPRQLTPAPAPSKCPNKRIEQV